MRIADSASSGGGIPVASISNRCMSFQLSLEVIRSPLASYSSRIGSLSVPLNGKEGPIARTKTLVEASPCTMHPPDHDVVSSLHKTTGGIFANLEPTVELTPYTSSRAMPVVLLTPVAIAV